MNLALPALAILLALLPGIVFERAYFNGRFARRIAGLSAVAEATLALLLAIPIDLTALWISNLVGLSVDWPAVERFVFGSLPDAAAVSALATSIRTDVRVTAVVYLLTVLGSYAIGSVCRRFVWACRLDQRFHILRMKNEWFYQLLGRDLGKPGLVSVGDVLTFHGSESILYRGVVAEFEIAESGALKLLTLTEAKRGKDRGDDFKWKDVPGNKLILLGSCIHSINITYLQVEPVTTSFWQRFIAEDL